MDEIKKQLGLPATATEAEVRAALVALQGKTVEAETAAATATAQGAAHLDAIAKLSAEVAALTKLHQSNQLESVIAEAKKSGKLTASLEPWARNLGGENMAALTSFLEKAEPLAALAGLQTGGKAPEDDGKGTAALTAEEKGIAEQFGMSEAEYTELIKGVK